MRDDHHRHAASGQISDDAEHVADQFGIERRSRLVEQHHLRIHGQRAGDGHALLLAAGKLGRERLDLVAEADALEQFSGGLLRLGARFAAHFHRRDRHVLQHAQMREQVELLKDHAQQLRLHGVGHLPAVHAAAVNIDFAGIDLLQTGDAARQSALARSAGADDRNHFSLVDVQRDAFQHVERAERLMQIFYFYRVSHIRSPPLKCVHYKSTISLLPDENCNFVYIFRERDAPHKKDRPARQPACSAKLFYNPMRRGI